MNEPVDKVVRRAERDRRARKEAEALLEAKSLELYRANERLREFAEGLEVEIAARTAQLKEALVRAEAATAAKSAFLAAVSHEIRTPLNGIIGITQLLLAETGDSAAFKRLRIIERSGSTLLALVNDLLDFTKIEAGYLELEKIDFELLSELRAAIDLHRLAASEKNIALSVDFLNLPTYVNGDPLRLRQILGNLLSNAIKFTDRGTVSVTISCIQNVGMDVVLEIRVKDTGIGISPENVQSIFTPFTQADSSTARRFGGTGLGLSIVRRLAQAMGGDVSVTSVLQEGTEFRCTVKFGVRASLPAAASASPIALEEPGFGALKILLVDDNEINQMVASEVLAGLGFESDLADSGLAAIEAFQNGEYDLVFMDLQMPEMDGIETTKRIRKMPCAIRPWIVALTANVLEAERKRCEEAEMDGFVAKPFQIEQIKKQLRDASRNVLRQKAL